MQLHACARATPDAVVLDLMMPGVDGFAVLEHLRADEETRSLPVVALTAKRLSREERSFLGVRALSLLEKSSYTASELRTLIGLADRG
jgi:CheY-like chemotaxis protein